MATKHKLNRKIRRSDITAYRTLTDNFILTPNKNFLTDSRVQGLSSEHSRTYPILKVEKPIKTKWKFEAIPNLRGIPNVRPRASSKNLLAREETFDADFMMPSQVREILEEEGLEKTVINGVIGRAEEKHRQILHQLKTSHSGQREDTQTEHIRLPPIITTHKPVLRYNGMGSSSWLDLSRQQPNSQSKVDLWENPLSHKGRDEYLSWNYGRDISSVVEDVQVELDRKKWVAAQHVEQLYSGDNFTPPRIVPLDTLLKCTNMQGHLTDENTPNKGVGQSILDRDENPSTRNVVWDGNFNCHCIRTYLRLVSSKVPKCHLLTKVYNEDVIPILYDFDSCTFTEILDAIAKKLNLFKRNCKAKSIMVLCQGGPGYIYLLKNFAITPQKLYKPSYRSVVGFWRALASMISKLHPEDAAIHIFGFKLTENEQGKKLLPMLQSLMYPNLVRVEVPTEDTDTGRDMINYYFKYSRYQVWKSYQKSSFNDIDFVQEETGPVKRHYRSPVLRVAR